MHASNQGLVPAAEFSVREYARTVHGSHRGELALDVFANDPLSPELLELVNHIAALERGALLYLRSVLVTPTHKDSRVTAFLVSWAYEKYWIADALEQIVLAHGVQLESGDEFGSRWERLIRGAAERFEPIRESIVANIIGEDVIAVHTFTGAIDDWIMVGTYDRLIERNEHAELTRVLTILREVKTRHEEFFTAQTRDRLARSSAATSLARRRLKKIAWPLGADELDPWPTARIFRSVLRPEDISAIDSRICELLGSETHFVAAAARGKRGRL